jgi:hypothetical protein
MKFTSVTLAATLFAALAFPTANAMADVQFAKHMDDFDAAYPCVSAPLPSEPIGDFNMSHFANEGEGYSIQAWRYPCDGDRSVPMFTVIPDPGDSPLFCPDQGLLIQGMRQDGHYRLVQDPMNPSEAFCGVVVVPTTLAMVGMGGHMSNLDQDFTFMFDPDQQQGMDLFGYHAGDYGVNSMGHTIGRHNGLTGVWYDPETQGQGFSIQMTPGGLILFYFGYDAAGSRLWLISSLENPPLAFADSITMALFQGAGGVFGQPMPDTEAWGEAELTFDDCDTGNATLDGTDGRIEMALVKLAGVQHLQCY